MRRVLTMLAVCVVAGGSVTPLLAQKSAPPVTRDADRDGVPDTRDRCRGTAAGTRVDATGCPAPAAAAPTAAAPTTATPARPRPSGAPAGAPVAGAPTTAAPTTTAAAPSTTAPAQSPPVQQAQTPATAAPPPSTTAPAPSTAAPAPGGAPTGGAAPTGAVVGAAGAAAAVPQADRGNQPATPPATRPAAPAAAPARAPRPVTDPTLTAGFWMPAFDGAGEAELLEYGRTLTLRLDSALVALRQVFNNTTGAPVMGATGPNILATREKGRWQQCRMIHFDLSTLGDAVTFLVDSLTAPTLNRAAVVLSDAFEGLNATAECDNIVSMVEVPDRWAPWQQNYETSARTFYRDWYAQLKGLHDASRTFALALNSALPAARQFPIPPALPPTPPTIGAVR